MKQIVATVDIAEGLASARDLVASFETAGDDMNEAQTRFRIIDELLVRCFGWPKSHIETERYERGEYTDYELGVPRQLVVEAKRTGTTFTLPAGSNGALFANIQSIYMLGGGVRQALEQAQGYASKRGVPIAVITNGHQFIAFLATRDDGHSPLEEGKCLVIPDYQTLLSRFPDVWQYFSPNGISDRILLRALQSQERPSVPEKLSSYLASYPRARYPSDLQATLSQLSEWFIQDIPASADFEKEFYEKCYCESGALSKHVNLSRRILEARYAALFPRDERAPAVVPAINRKGDYELTPEVFSAAISARPVVLVGDVGVGKTSFIKHLKHTGAHEAFRNAIYIYINLGTRAALNSDISEFVLTEIEQQLAQIYDVDIFEEAFVKGAFASELSRFDKGIWGKYKEVDSAKYEEKRLEHLEVLLANRSEHLRRSVDHLARGRHKQIIICIDNADQRDSSVQQDAFIISQEFAARWQATVFLSVRPQTFFKSKQSGALSAYPHKVFSISPPRPDVVISRRLEFALTLASGQQSVDGQSVVNVSSLELFLKAILYSLPRNKDLLDFLSNITGGNIREVIDLVTKFIGSPNVDANKILDMMEKHGSYVIPLHEFTKPALLGSYSHYHGDSAIAMNVFEVSMPDRHEHFLISLLIAYLNADGPHRDKHGFVEASQIFDELQGYGFAAEQIEDGIRRSTNKKLLETPQRITFEEDQTRLIGNIPDKLRASSVGIYHVFKWMPTFSYLDAMAFDTPIFDDETMKWMTKDVESFDIQHRLARAKSFRRYLEESWDEARISSPYFNFAAILPKGQSTFQRVEEFVKKRDPVQ